MKNTKRIKHGGRQKGTPNKSTLELRNNYVDFFINNAEKMQGLFDEVAKDDPAKALELFLKISTFIIPKPLSVEIIDKEKTLKPPIIKFVRTN